MRQKHDQHESVLELRKQGKSLGSIANELGISKSTVQSIIRRSGEFHANPDHDVYFAPLKPIEGCTSVSIVEHMALDAKTGNKALDAYISARLTASIGTQESKANALAMIEAITANTGKSERELEGMFSDWNTGEFMKDNKGAHALQVAFGTFFVSGIEKVADIAISKRKSNDEAVSLFGDVSGAFNLTPQERKLLANYDNKYSSLVKSGVYDSTCSKTGEKFLNYELFYSDESKCTSKEIPFNTGYAIDLFKGTPKPHTITQCINEFEWWERINSLRNDAPKEIQNAFNYNVSTSVHIHCRLDYIKYLMTVIKPSCRDESMMMLKFLSRSEFENLEYENAIFNNILG